MILGEKMCFFLFVLLSYDLKICKSWNKIVYSKWYNKCLVNLSLSFLKFCVEYWFYYEDSWSIVMLWLVWIVRMEIYFIFI